MSWKLGPQWSSIEREKVLGGEDQWRVGDGGGEGN